MADREDRTFDEAVDAGMSINMKSVVDQWAAEAYNRATQQSSLQDKINGQFLRFVEDQHTLIMRTADSGALVANRAANNAATLDLLIAAGEVDTTAQGAIGAKIADEVRSAVKIAMEGTMAVAEGGLQIQEPVELAQILTNNITIQTALLEQMAKLTAVLDVLVVQAAK